MNAQISFIINFQNMYITQTLYIINLDFKMVKLSNKGKGKPSKRTTLKTKYKIQRKVKQYRKKVKKQAKKLSANGIRHKKHPQRDVLPNMFPFKQQILQQFKDSLPKQPQAPIETLSGAQFGLVTMENKQVYFPKKRDNLTKKYLTNIDAIFKKARIVLQILDSRNPQICIDESFRALCKKNNVHVISVLSKIDTVPEKKVLQAEQRFIAKKERVVKFTHDGKFKKQLIEELIKAIQLVKSQIGINQKQSVSVFVAGKQNTGKHTFISLLCKYAGKYQDLPSELFELILIPGVKIIDAPYKIDDKTNFPLFTTPSEIRYPDQSLNSQQQNLIKYLFFGGLSHYKGPVLSRSQIIQNYMIQDYNSVQDLCKKVGKSLKLFGKGGMIDVAKVKNKILSEWFQGKLNKFISAA